MARSGPRGGRPCTQIVHVGVDAACPMPVCTYHTPCHSHIQRALAICLAQVQHPPLPPTRCPRLPLQPGPPRDGGRTPGTPFGKRTCIGGGQCPRLQPRHSGSTAPLKVVRPSLRSHHTGVATYHRARIHRVHLGRTRTAPPPHVAIRQQLPGGPSAPTQHECRTLVLDQLHLAAGG